MKTPVAVFASAILAAAPGALLAAGTVDSGMTRNFTKDVSAAGLNSVHLSLGVGEVDVSAGAGDSIKVHVTARPGQNSNFIFKWTVGNAESPLPPNLKLVVTRHGNQLDLRLSPDSDLKSSWTVVLPARLALALDGHVGKLRVSGIAGGLTATLNVGSVEAALVNGPATVSTNVGNIRVNVTNPDYGKVDLNADVGGVRFSVNGSTVTSGLEHQFTSAAQQLSGPGKTTYSLKVNTGHAELNLGAATPLQPPGPSTGDSEGGNH